MGSADEDATNDTPGPNSGASSGDAAMTPGWSGSDNPYLSDLLDRSLIDLSSGQPVEGQLGTHHLRARPDGQTGHAIIDGYDNLGPSRTPRSRLRLSCALSFQIGDTATTPCEAGSIHVLDDALMFVGSGGHLGGSRMPDGVSYVLVAPPDLVVAIERLVVRNASNRPELAGFRTVLVNPVQKEPLVVVTSGLDRRALATLVAAGEVFMREQVGSKAGWRPLGDGWETMEWNGSATPAATPPSTPDASTTAAPAPSTSAAVPSAVATTAAAAAGGSASAGPPATPAPTRPAAATASTGPGRLPAAKQTPTYQQHEPEGDEGGASSRRFGLLAALAVVAVIVVGVAWAASRGGDSTDAGNAETAPSSTASTEPAETTSTTASTTTTEAEPTTTLSTTTTTEPEPTTTEVTGPQPVTESEQLSVWGFTEPIVLDAPSGDAICPSGAPSVKATVVGVRAALNVRDGADSSFEILQRLVLGYDDVDVYPDATERSARGTNWVTIALAQPPGTASADRRCGWAATQFLDFAE